MKARPRPVPEPDAADVMWDHGDRLDTLERRDSEGSLFVREQCFILLTGSTVPPYDTYWVTHGPYTPGGPVYQVNDHGTDAEVIVTYTSSGSFDATGVSTVDVLVAAGGGGGGAAGSNNAGGGGGGGGVIHNETYSVSGTVSLTIGAGGAGGSNGTDSTFGGLIAIGGGHGGGVTAPGSGGSGGGTATVAGSAGSGTAGQGHDGGISRPDSNGYHTSARDAAGGGGGAASAGTDGKTGLTYIPPSGARQNAYAEGGGGGAKRGPETYGYNPFGYGAGGGGGGGTTSRGRGGDSGGAGAWQTLPGEDGYPHTGNGGGGGNYSESHDTHPGSGADGAVVVHYHIATWTPPA